MTTFDDLPYSCPLCSIGLDDDSFCPCDDDPCCVRCHRIAHVEHIGRWSNAELDAKIRGGLSGWGGAA